MRSTSVDRKRFAASRASWSAAAMLCALAMTGGASAQVLWKGEPERLPVRMTVNEMADVAAAAALRMDAKRLVAQFDAPITPAQRAVLANAGLSLLSYLGNNAFFVSVDAQTLNTQALLADGALTSLRPIEPAWKVHPMLNAAADLHWMRLDDPKADEGRTPDDGVRADDMRIAVYVMTHTDAPTRTEGTLAVLKHGGAIRGYLESVNAMVVEMPRSGLDGLAHEDAVQWIEPALPRFDEQNNSNRLRTGADLAQMAPYNLNGAGVSVMVYDGGRARSTHQDFGGRLFERDDSNTSSHATHVSGTVGGSGAASGGTYRGMAPGVTIQSYGLQQAGGLQQGFLYTDPCDIEADYGQAINVHNVAVTNNSIGTNVAQNGYPCEWHGNYGVTDTVIDAIARGSLGRGVPIVWAAGNERGNGRCGTSYGTAAPPANAKNHITIGALNSNNDSVTSFTSWGPSDDGRLMPDVSAPGCQNGPDAAGVDWNGGNSTVSSTTSGSDTSYGSACGTSMAAPTATGLVALILQDFRANNPSVPDPLPSTIKALLIHTAADIENFGPDYKTGYGSIRVIPAVDHMRTGNYAEGELFSGEAYAAEVVVQPGEDFKATLVWSDPPGTPNVSPALVNDLDLVVTDPNGIRRYPWTLTPANPGAAAVRTQVDRINNIEQVFVEDATPGMWTVEIHVHNMPQGPQTFSLLANGQLIPGPVSLSLTSLGAPGLIAPGHPLMVDVTINENDDTLVPGTAMMHLRTAPGTFTTSPLSEIGGGQWQATLPGFVCDDEPEFYFSAEGVTTGVRTSPANAPANLFSTSIGVLDEMHPLIENFVSGALPVGWTATGLWNITASCGDSGCEGGFFAYYGQTSTCNYDTGATNSGSLTSPPIELPATESGVSIMLEYCSRRQTESSTAWDLTQLRIGEAIIDQPTGTNLDWQTRTVDLTAYAGQTIQLDFFFNTRDGIQNNFLGWQVDGITITTIAPVCEDVFCPGDTNGDGVVDFADFSTVLNQYGQTGPGLDGDLNGDGVVDFTDFSAVLNNYGAVCL